MPTPLTTSPSPGVRCTTRAATATRRTRSPPAPGTQGQKYFSHSFKYFYASALLQVRDVQVSAVQVRLQPAGRGPGLLLLRGRRVQGGRHLIYILTYLQCTYLHITYISTIAQDCVCQPRYPPGCTCDPFSPDPDSSCPGQQTCKQCKCLGEWFIVSTVHTCLHGVHVSNVSLGLIMLPPPLCKASYPLSTHLLCFVWSKAAPIRNIIFATICVSTL